MPMDIETKTKNSGTFFIALNLILVKYLTLFVKKYKKQIIPSRPVPDIILR